jgi:hypothetical protein
MEELIKKWKTIIKNEKSNENQDLSQSSANFSRLKSSEKVLPFKTRVII